ncbi:hypothetical protein [Streptosporangium lutulentum]|uniref:Uncharacterized protein n=1 Tax=Streptosporangium lutulentum TaxID=1461250 RepID=A0ABT9QUC0_9ACTN|nr:hypothetical protein [Streptosporangium lutulentum]
MSAHKVSVPTCPLLNGETTAPSRGHVRAESSCFTPLQISPTRALFLMPSPGLQIAISRRLRALRPAAAPALP